MDMLLAARNEIMPFVLRGNRAQQQGSNHQGS